MNYNEICMESETLDSFISVLKENCSEIISIYKTTNLLLYRGTQARTEDFFISKSRNNRQSVTIPPYFNNSFDKWMQDHGLIALRGNSIFTTSNYETAESYGNVYVIFPKNGFNYTWFSEGSGDLYFDYNNVLDELSISYSDVKNKKITKKQIIDVTNNVMKKSKPINTNIQKGMIEEHEIMINCSEYYAIFYEICENNINKILY